LVLHDGDGATPMAQAILRDGAALDSLYLIPRIVTGRRHAADRLKRRRCAWLAA
jgi:hypothetical protein